MGQRGRLIVTLALEAAGAAAAPTRATFLLGRPLPAGRVVVDGVRHGHDGSLWYHVPGAAAGDELLFLSVVYTHAQAAELRAGFHANSATGTEPVTAWGTADDEGWVRLEATPPPAGSLPSSLAAGCLPAAAREPPVDAATARQGLRLDAAVELTGHRVALAARAERVRLKRAYQAVRGAPLGGVSEGAALARVDECEGVLAELPGRRGRRPAPAALAGGLQPGTCARPGELSVGGGLAEVVVLTLAGVTAQSRAVLFPLAPPPPRARPPAPAAAGGGLASPPPAPDAPTDVNSPGTSSTPSAPAAAVRPAAAPAATLDGLNVGVSAAASAPAAAVRPAPAAGRLPRHQCALRLLVALFPFW
jgi:hypothetical protein